MRVRVWVCMYVYACVCVCVYVCVCVTGPLVFVAAPVSQSRALLNSSTLLLVGGKKGLKKKILIEWIYIFSFMDISLEGGKGRTLSTVIFKLTLEENLKNYKKKFMKTWKCNRRFNFFLFSLHIHYLTIYLPFYNLQTSRRNVLQPSMFNMFLIFNIFNIVVSFPSVCQFQILLHVFLFSPLISLYTLVFLFDFLHILITPPPLCTWNFEL